ncbi:hypothetical protein [Serinicoccus hydrothermalis]|uniref:hypothetical protein n=1 Tax=Serinicoccus hydrothermalis TaxID=1758689 RepID=UPI0012FC5D56|nr:hypothetical protein [Serinicoccus hydrothermalis]
MDFIIEHESAIRTLSIVVGALAAIATLIFNAVSLRNLTTEQKQSSDLLRKEHASLISVWVISGPPHTLVISNKSNVPAAHVACRTYTPSGTQSFYTYTRSLPPGEHQMPIRAQEPHSVDISYTDHRGQRWRRNRHQDLEFFNKSFTLSSGVDLEPVLKKAAREFEEDFGVRASYKRHDGGRPLRSQFLASRLEPEAALDAIVGADDWLGELKQHAMLRPISPPRAISEGAPTHRYWERLAADGLYFGAPIALDTMVAHINRDIVGDVEHRSLIDLFNCDHAATRHNQPRRLIIGAYSKKGNPEPFVFWPLLQSFGISLFARDDATRSWVPDESVFDSLALEPQRLARFRSWVARTPELSSYKFDQDEARKRFKFGEYAILIDTVSARRHYTRLQDNVDIIPLKTGFGAETGIFMSHVFYASEFGPNRTVAQDYLPLMMDDETISDMLGDELLMPVIRGNQVVITSDVARDVWSTAEAASAMPNGPFADKFWQWASHFIANIIRQEEGIEDVRNSSRRALAALVQAEKEAYSK